MYVCVASKAKRYGPGPVSHGSSVRMKGCGTGKDTVTHISFPPASGAEAD